MAERNGSATAGRGIALGLLLAGAAAGLSGCVGAAVGAGAATATAAAEERGIGGAATDLRIRAEINARWLDHDADMYTDAGITVHEGRVLLTGIVATPAARGEAVRLAWQAGGVREVINEIAVGDGTGLVRGARDSWITTQLTGRLTFDSEIQAINYSVKTVDGVVYLMGIAQDAAEERRVLNHARGIAYVRRVVSYVLVKTDPKRARGG